MPPTSVAPETTTTPSTDTQSTSPVTPPKVEPMAAMIPPQVLPSHHAPHTHAARPLSSPHQEVTGLNKSLAEKIGEPAATSATLGGAGSPPTPPSHPTIDTTVSSPDNKKGGFGFKTLIAIIVFVLTVGGAGAAYYLNTQSQDNRQQAYLPDWEDVGEGQSRQICGGSSANDIQENQGLLIQVQESPMCGKLQGRTGNNSISNYSATYKVINTSDHEVEITYKKHSNYCPEKPYGTDGDNPGCHDNEQVETATARLNSGGNGDSSSVTVTVNNTPASCGSWQTDLNITKIVVYKKGTNEVIKTINEAENDSCIKSNDVEGWTMCQTGNSCAQGGATSSCDSITTSADAVTVGENITVKLNGTNNKDYQLFYAPEQQNYCGTPSPFTGIPATNAVNGEFTWNTAGLAPGKYHISGIAHGNDGSHCSANPSGSCGTAFKECKQCGKTITINPPPQVAASCDTITVAETAVVGQPVSIQLSGTNVNQYRLFYASEQQDYCPTNGINAFTEISTGNATGTFSWDTTGLPEGSYYIAATAQLANGTSCSANPSGACGTAFTECKNCGKKITLTNPPTPEVGMCVNLCGVASGNEDIADMSRCGTSGGLLSTPKFDEYLHLKCAVKGNVGSVSIMLTRPGFPPEKINSNNNLTAVYKINAAGTYSATCSVTKPAVNNSPVTQPDTTSPTSACENAGGTCRVGSNCRTGTALVAGVSCPSLGTSRGQLCCKDTTGVNPPSDSDNSSRF